MKSFWDTISKYPVFVAWAILGVLLFAAKPLLPFFKNPVTAIALVAACVAAFTFLTFTLRAMLGLQVV